MIQQSLEQLLTVSKPDKKAGKGAQREPHGLSTDTQCSQWRWSPKAIHSFSLRKKENGKGGRRQDCGRQVSRPTRHPQPAPSPAGPGGWH